MDTATTAQSETLALAGSVAVPETRRPEWGDLALGTCDIGHVKHPQAANCHGWRRSDLPPIHVPLLDNFGGSISIPPRSWHEPLGGNCRLYMTHSHTRVTSDDVDSIVWNDGAITERPPSNPLPTGKALLEAWGEVEDRLRDNPPTNPLNDRIQFSMDAEPQEYTTRPFIQRILNDYHAIRAAGHAHEEALDLLRLAYPV